MKIVVLRPGDIAVALQLATSAGDTLAKTAKAVGRSIGEVHNAIIRLTAARLADPDTRLIYRDPLLRFIEWGVPHAFPATIGGPAVGVPTSWDAVPRGVNAAETDDGQATRIRYVWPSVGGAARGLALYPLYPITPAIVDANRPLWAALALVDAVRTGGAREAGAAARALAALLPNLPPVPR